MKAIIAFAAYAAVALLAGCASFDGSSLVAGKSTATEVEALMGAPAERLEQANGEKVYFYSRLRETFAVVLHPNGTVKAVEPRRLQANLGRLEAGRSTTKDVRALFGPPQQVSRLDRQKREVWEYLYTHYQEYRVIWFQFSDDGVMRETLDMLDYPAYPQDGPGFV
jgi:hypothetical protein